MGQRRLGLGRRGGVLPHHALDLGDRREDDARDGGGEPLRRARKALTDALAREERAERVRDEVLGVEKRQIGPEEKADAGAHERTGDDERMCRCGPMAPPHHTCDRSDPGGDDRRQAVVGDVHHGRERVGLREPREADEGVDAESGEGDARRLRRRRRRVPSRSRTP